MHEVGPVVVVHGLRLVQPYGTLEAMSLLRRLVARVDHAVVVVFVVAQLLRDRESFAHAHDRQLTSRQ